jgi:hypothetical protein
VREYPIAGFATDLYEDAEFIVIPRGTQQEEIRGRCLSVNAVKYDCVCFVYEDADDGLQYSAQVWDRNFVRFKQFPSEAFDQPTSKPNWWQRFRAWLLPPQKM